MAWASTALIVYSVDYAVNIRAQPLHCQGGNPENRAQTERRAPLTRERILEAGVALADRGGLDNLSMRKLGQELGVDAMAIYRHIKGKDDLLDGVAEVVIGEIERPAAGGDWIQDLRGSSWPPEP